VLELADMMETGLPPAAGGSLDQIDAVLQAFRFVRSERRRLKNEELD